MIIVHNNWIRSFSLLILISSHPATCLVRKCGKDFHLDTKYPSATFNQKYYGIKNRCVWAIIGDVNCDVELSCKIDIPKGADDCADDFVKISDGAVAAESFCGSVEVAKRASEGLRDLFVVFSSSPNPMDRKFDGVSCSARCAKPTGVAERLQKPIKKRIDQKCVCGFQNNQDNRIVGGEDATQSEFPWQAAIVYPNTRNPSCGASVINDRIILTAAHCFWFENKKPDDIEVLLHAHLLDMTKKRSAKDVELGQAGSIRGHGYNLSRKTDFDEGSQRFKVLELINHPFFTENYDYDYALLHVDKKINLGGQDAVVTPICLPSPVQRDMDAELSGKKLMVVGWGMAAENAGGTTRLLQKLEVPYIKSKKCAKWLPKSTTDRMICAGYPEGIRDACTGDSGGPLILKQEESKQWVQYGIVSWGEGCARKEKPGIYSKVTEMLQWIHFQANEFDAKWCREK